MTHDSRNRRAEVTAYAASAARQPGTLGYLFGSLASGLEARNTLSVLERAAQGGEAFAAAGREAAQELHDEAEGDSAEVVQDMLSLAGADVSQEEIAAWRSTGPRESI